MADRTDKTSNGRDAPTLCAKMARRRSERDIFKLPTLQSGSGIDPLNILIVGVELEATLAVRATLFPERQGCRGFGRPVQGLDVPRVVENRIFGVHKGASIVS